MAAPRKPRPKAPSLKDLIRNWPEVPRLEMAWYKQKGKPGVLRPAAIHRGPRSVDFEHPLELDSAGVHTHVAVVRSGYPSARDLILFSVLANRIPIQHIAVVQKNKEFAGYYSMKLTKKFFGLPHNELAAIDKELIRIKRVKNRLQRTSQVIAFLKKLKDNQLIIEHETAASGFYFDPILGTFMNDWRKKA